ncbi:hypothetical protein C4J81_10605 [Deltaproteobacteria bacterium Smac51]|nr:hypothetical protein C4J81_10605 [Deltaproteobacteria bacterium Smac51]
MRKLFAAALLISAITLNSAPAPAQNEAQREFMAGLSLEYSPEAAPDYQKAAGHYERAAAAGSREALLALSRLKGPLAPLWRDGASWRDSLLAASRAGWPEAAFQLAQALEKNEVPREGLTPAQFYLQSAASGYGPAALRLGEMYLSGSGNLNKDESQAALWLTVAAENHEPSAALALGKLYYEKNPATASRWLERSDLPEASYLLGEIYLKDRRFIEAVSAFTFSSDQGYAPAHLSLGLLNLDNEFGRRPNPREALRHLKIAAQADLPEGSYHLAQMYIKGQGTPKDTITGAFWLSRAAAKGHAEAQSEYDKLTYNFTVGQKKRLERMIEEGFSPTMQTTVQ